MTATEAIEYIENFGWSTTRLGLYRTRELLSKLGDPQKKLKFIHVAGSNGKGSSCAMFDAILRAEGYRTGLYTSPYIQEFCERIQVDGNNISGDELAAITERVKEIAEKMEDHPSQFELVTAIAMQYFLEKKCDIVVLEVGMGGELDSTNVIDAPELAVITNIGLDHTEYLGDTLEKIAKTKAGIIKTGASCVCYDGAQEVTDVIRTVCGEKNVPLTCVDFSNMLGLSSDLYGQDIKWKNKTYHLNLIGEHQQHNAALVLTGVEVLRERGWVISDDSVSEGLASVKWPARLEVLNTSPVFILDGGHNPQCAEALARSFRTILPGKKAVILIGVLADKDYSKIIDHIMPYAREFVCVTPNSSRRLPAGDLKAYIESRGADATACDSIEEGVFEAIERAGRYGCVVAFGSLYMAGAVRTYYHEAYRRWLRKISIEARNNVRPEDREKFSADAVDNIVNSEMFKKANTILVYAHTKGEISIDSIVDRPESEGKRFCYPACTGNSEFIALVPKDKASWKDGCFGIREPVRELSEEVAPEDIDLVICPCSAFDEHCSRMGMGAGFYDRYLPKCINAAVCAAAFEVQKADCIPVEEWDRPMDAVFTEKCSYYR